MGRSALRHAGQSKQAGRGCASRNQALAVVTASMSSTQTQARRRNEVRRLSAVMGMRARAFVVLHRKGEPGAAARRWPADAFHRRGNPVNP